MTETNRSAKRKLFTILASLALFASACGGGEGGSGASLDRAASEAAAAANTSALSLTQDFGSTELLNAADGSIKSLTEVVTDDRAILVWYWAPH